MKALFFKFGRPNLQSSTNLGVLALVHLGLLAAIAITTAVAAMPFNTLNLSDDVRNTVMSLIPEGWGFFTKSPRDPEMRSLRLVRTALGLQCGRCAATVPTLTKE